MAEPIRADGRTAKELRPLRFQNHIAPHAAGAILPKSIRYVPDAVEYLKQVLNPKRDTPLNSLESLFAGIETGKKS